MAGVGRMEVDIRDLSLALGRLGEGVDRALDTAAMAGGLVVEGEMKQNIIETDYIDTGATLNSTAARPGDQDGEVDVGPATEYASFGELGLGGQEERRFARDALEQNRAAIEAAVVAELREAIRRSVG